MGQRPGPGRWGLLPGGAGHRGCPFGGLGTPGGPAPLRVWLQGVAGGGEGGGGAGGGGEGGEGVVPGGGEGLCLALRVGAPSSVFVLARTGLVRRQENSTQ